MLINLCQITLGSPKVKKVFSIAKIVATGTPIAFDEDSDRYILRVAISQMTVCVMNAAQANQIAEFIYSGVPLSCRLGTINRKKYPADYENEPNQPMEEC